MHLIHIVWQQELDELNNDEDDVHRAYEVLSQRIEVMVDVLCVDALDVLVEQDELHEVAVLDEPDKDVIVKEPEHDDEVELLSHEHHHHRLMYDEVVENDYIDIEVEEVDEDVNEDVIQIQMDEERELVIQQLAQFLQIVGDEVDELVIQHALRREQMDLLRYAMLQMEVLVLLVLLDELRY